MDTLDNLPNEKQNSNDYQIAMWGHLIGLLSCWSGFFGIIGTVIFYVVNQDKSVFIKQHAAQALNFQITYFLSSMFITFLVGTIILGSMFGNLNNFGNSAVFFSTMGTGVIVGITFFIINLIGCIKSALAANKGEMWHNPMAITLIKVK
jgi:uncharacterized Tic20 family protein